MKIVVCVKQVPDSAAKVVVENGKVSWGDAPLVINPWDEYAMEAALQQREAHGGTVTAITMGGESVKDALKHALAMGADDAILISDPALSNLDTQATAQVLSAAIQKIGGVDMAFFGRQAIDGDAGLVPAQTARLLDWPALTLASTIKVEGNSIRVERAIEEGRQVVTAKLPAIFSLVKDFGEPRYPSFMGIRKASRAEIPAWSLAELSISAPAAVIAWTEIMNPPSREVKCDIVTGGSPEEIAEALADKILAEKVL
ncbi:MAG: electron transfer flavoprotein subunit beta/FixA family protein [Anaerolineales bacterium]|nr:electron transfer flavoprotein subunit beta/FixA family protein [Anaerolineales bacterium]MDO9347814.1 electron transfer flavoprotein subunit beta/FixA family protein [Anaerolineales bacterium]